MGIPKCYFFKTILFTLIKKVRKISYKKTFENYIQNYTSFLMCSTIQL